MKGHFHTVSAPLKCFKHMKDIGIFGSEPNEAVNFCSYDMTTTRGGQDLQNCRLEQKATKCRLRVSVFMKSNENI